MNLFGLEIRRKGSPSMSTVADNRGGWWPWVREPFAGAFQRDIEWTTDSVLAHHAVFTCTTLISSDIGKLRPKLVEQDENGIWSEVKGRSIYQSVLRKPNRYQNHIQFKEWWVTSKLVRGNTYVLKERYPLSPVVKALYILDPSRVQVMVTADGGVYYQLGDDNLSGLQTNGVLVPASEIIHDRMNCLFHPLVGVSPIFACGAAANIGLKIEENAAGFFANGSSPSGILTAPTVIPDDVAKRLKEHWDREYSGANAGKVAVLGSGLTFQPMRMTAVDSQMIEHLQWTAKVAAATYHVPAFKAGVGEMPTYQNGETLNQIYYSDCLQSHIEQFELCMDEGLGLSDGKIEGRTLGVELELKGLLRMDTKTQMETMGVGVQRGIYSPNEARREFDLTPVEGGNTPYLQQQNYPLPQLDRPVEVKALPAPAPVADDGEELKALRADAHRRKAVEIFREALAA